MGQYRYQKRRFLNPIDSAHPSYVYALAESSEEGSYPLGNYLLWVADCGRSIALEFSLASATLRKQSLAKADIVADVVCGFRDALQAEAFLIERAERDAAEEREQEQLKRRAEKKQKKAKSPGKR